jgi:hypothetical protein
MYAYKYAYYFTILFIGVKGMASPDNNNPLKKYFRQPKIYLRLPSEGKFYAPGSLDMTENGELPVFAMTAKDELMMKTPDALLNGEATVSVIKSCIPNIKDPWKMPSIDSDAILVAIRLATYGESLDISTKLPVTGEEREFSVDLKEVLDQLISARFDPYVEIDDNITVELKPATYKEWTQNALKTFEEQRILRIVNDDSIPDDEKLQAFANSFKKLTDITIDVVVKSIVAVNTPDGRVTDTKHIFEFFSNSDKTAFNKILEHLEKAKTASTVKPFVARATPEDIERGVPETFEVPITFDQSSFFA